MSRILAGLALLLAADAARADMGFPGMTRVPTRVTLTADRDYPGYRFYLLSFFSDPRRRVWPIAVGPAKPFHIQSATLRGWETSDIVLPGLRDGTVYVVPPGWPAPPPDVGSRHEWFDDPKNALRLGGIGGRGSVWVFEFRDRVELTYRVEAGPDGGGLVYVGQNPGYGWVCCLSGVLLPVGVVWLGMWLARWVRHQRA